MKPKAEKYVEAVERNMKSAGGPGSRISKWRELPIAEIKMKLGIKKADTSFDEEVVKMFRISEDERIKGES